MSEAAAAAPGTFTAHASPKDGMGRMGMRGGAAEVGGLFEGV